MNRKLAVGLVALGIMGMLFLVSFSATSISASPRVIYTHQIFIRPDGSIEPSSALIHRDGDIYTFVGTVRDEIIVQKSNIIIDGNGLKLDMTTSKYRGGPMWELSNVNNITIRHMAIGDRNNLILDNCHFCQIVDTNFSSISLSHSHNNLISENFVGELILEYCVNNTISYNSMGSIELDNSFYNKILYNRITFLSVGAFIIDNSDSNLFFGNIVSRPCQVWIKLWGNSSNNQLVANNITGPFVIHPIITCSGTNLFYHNNFVNASAKFKAVLVNNASLMDNGTAGNYWSDYNGTDNNGDGIGDTPYIIDANNQDNHPLSELVNLALEPEPTLPPYDASWVQPSFGTPVVIYLLVVLGIISALAAVTFLYVIYNKPNKKSKIIGTVGV